MTNTPSLPYNIQKMVSNFLILLKRDFINEVSNTLMNCVKYTIDIRIIQFNKIIL